MLIKNNSKPDLSGKNSPPTRLSSPFNEIAVKLKTIAEL
jgi:hypothetical protein